MTTFRMTKLIVGAALIGTMFTTVSVASAAPEPETTITAAPSDNLWNLCVRLRDEGRLVKPLEHCFNQAKKWRRGNPDRIKVGDVLRFPALPPAVSPEAPTPARAAVAATVPAVAAPDRVAELERQLAEAQAALTVAKAQRDVQTPDSRPAAEKPTQANAEPQSVQAPMTDLVAADERRTQLQERIIRRRLAAIAFGLAVLGGACLYAQSFRQLQASRLQVLALEEQLKIRRRGNVDFVLPERLCPSGTVLTERIVVFNGFNGRRPAFAMFCGFPEEEQEISSHLANCGTCQEVINRRYAVVIASSHFGSPTMSRRLSAAAG